MNAKELETLLEEVAADADRWHAAGRPDECPVCVTAFAIEESRVIDVRIWQSICLRVLREDKHDMHVLLARMFAAGMRYATESALTAMVEGRAV